MWSTIKNLLFRSKQPSVILHEDVLNAEFFEEKLRKKDKARANLKLCASRQIETFRALSTFYSKYSRSMIDDNPTLMAQENDLIAAKILAHKERVAAAEVCNRATIEDILYIVAENGHLLLVSRLINLSRSTRSCKHLQPLMREVTNKSGMTQLHYFCEKGMKKSVMRMLEMEGIDVEALRFTDGWTCLISAANNGHVEICQLLLDKGAQLNAEFMDDTPLHRCSIRGHLDMVRFLCNRGANIEARGVDGCRPLHRAVMSSKLTVVKEFVLQRKADINARTTNLMTPLKIARLYGYTSIAYFLHSQGGVE